MFWPFYGLHLFEFARGYKYPWRVYPMPYPAMVRIRAPYTIYAIYVSGCPWSIREYIHSPSRSVCHFRANVFFHFSSTFSTLQINEHISGTLRSQVSGLGVSGLGSIGRSAPVRPSVRPSVRSRQLPGASLALNVIRNIWLMGVFPVLFAENFAFC